MTRTARSATIFFVFLAVMFAFSMGDTAAAGPLGFKIKQAVAGNVNGGKQDIIFEYIVQNTSQHEYISRLTSLEVEVTGNFGNGRQEKYRRKVDINYNFDPALGPGNTKTLRSRFKRTVNTGRGMPVYDNVRIKVLRYNFKRTS